MYHISYAVWAFLFFIFYDLYSRQIVKTHIILVEFIFYIIIYHHKHVRLTTLYVLWAYDVRSYVVRRTLIVTHLLIHTRALPYHSHILHTYRTYKHMVRTRTHARTHAHTHTRTVCVAHTPTRTLYIISVLQFYTHCLMYMMSCILIVIHPSLIVHCTLYNVQYTLYTVYCTLYGHLSIRRYLTLYPTRKNKVKWMYYLYVGLLHNKTRITPRGQ